MEAQLISREVLQQQAANAKPEGITAGQNHPRATSSKRLSQSLNRHLGLVGVEELSTLRQLVMQPAWRSNHRSNFHQLTLDKSQAMQARSSGSDHVEHHSILQAG